MTTPGGDPFVWGEWHRFYTCMTDEWQRYWPDMEIGPERQIPCEWLYSKAFMDYPPDSSVWAWGEEVPYIRRDSVWQLVDGERDSFELGPDTYYFKTRDYDPNFYTFKPEVYGPYPPEDPEADRIWYLSQDSLSIWVVKVEIDTTRSSMLFEVPLEGEEGVQDTAQTVFTILPDTSFFESPVMDSLRFLHYVTTETEGGAIDTVKSKWLFELDTLEMLEAGEKPYWVVQWLQQDDDEEWLDPEDNPFKSHIRMEWINRDEETRQMTRHNGDEEHRAEGNAIDLLVYLRDGSQLPEEAEQGDGSGMFVKLNDDYDAGQESPDWELEQVLGENDLVRIEIKPMLDEQGEVIRVGKLVLEIAKPQGEGGGMGDLLEKVKIWKHREKGSGNLLIGGDEPPARTWDLASGEDVEELMKFVGSTASETLWVEGCKEPSERLKDWRLVLTLEDEQGSKAEEDVVEGTVMRMNLEIPGLIEKDETKVGCFVLYNDDDDNCNRVKDKDEIGPIVADANINISQDEDNLVRARMIVEPLPTGGRAQLMTISNRLRLWSQPNKGPGNEIQLDENTAEWDLGDGAQREAYLSLVENVWIEGNRAAQYIRDDGLLLRYVAEGSEANWLADTVKVSVSRLNVYVPELYPWSQTPTPEPFRLQVVTALEAGDSAFSNAAFLNTGEWYRLQTELGSEPDTVDGIPLPQGFTLYEHLDPVRFPRVVVRPDVFENWGIQIDGWIAKAGPHIAAHHRDYWYNKDPGVHGLWNANWSAHFWEGIMGTCRMVAILSSPYGTLNSPVLEYCTRTGFRGHFPDDANGKPFLAWATTFLEVPYEWGGYWYGGRIGRNTGGVWTYDGYGMDCSGLISAAAYWAGYRWTEWRLNTTGLVSVSDPISAADAQPDDILNKPEAHVVAIIRRNPGSPLIDIIEASPAGRRVWIRENRRIIEHYINQGYVARRLNP